MKGQKARAGNSMRPELRDLIKKIPKLRGHGKNRARTVHSGRPVALVVNVEALSEHFNAGAEVSPRALADKGLIRLRGGDKSSFVKILGNGALDKKLTIVGCKVSAVAREKIIAQGGTVA